MIKMPETPTIYDTFIGIFLVGFTLAVSGPVDAAAVLLAYFSFLAGASFVNEKTGLLATIGYLFAPPITVIVYHHKGWFTFLESLR